MKRSNKYKATLLLIFVTIGFLISSVFTGTFTGRLLTALFSASMIGGIADWFGITALFSRPLGIPFKTEIIQHSRDRISESLVTAVEEELLTKEAIFSKLDRLDFAGKLIHYLEKQDGKRELAALAKKIVFDLLETTDPHKTGQYLDRIILTSSGELKTYTLFMNAVRWLSQNWNNEKIIATLADNLKDIIIDPDFSLLITDTIDNIYRQLGESADRESAGKRLFFKVMLSISGFTGASSTKLAARFQIEALEYLNRIKLPDSEQRQALGRWIETSVSNFENNSALRETIERKSLELLRNDSLGQAVTGFLFPYLSNTEQVQSIDQALDSLADKLVDDFVKNPADRERLNTYIRSVLADLVNEYHGEIGKLVRNKMNMFSNEMLVKMIEERAGNDLQIIRINGSIVGGIAGMVIFLLTFWIK